jgi:hypothetical protein
VAEKITQYLCLEIFSAWKGDGSFTGRFGQAGSCAFTAAQSEKQKQIEYEVT